MCDNKAARRYIKKCSELNLINAITLSVIYGHFIFHQAIVLVVTIKKQILNLEFSKMQPNETLTLNYLFCNIIKFIYLINYLFSITRSYKNNLHRKNFGKPDIDLFSSRINRHAEVSRNRVYGN